jgi:dinuclear metal center YbgI/SA1388 family protein
MDVAMADLDALVDHAMKKLRAGEYRDWPNACNGLQVANAGRVRRIVASVDASEAAIRFAGARSGSLLLVHHGLFWGGVQPLTGAFGRKIRFVHESDLAVLSLHLPLDGDPQFGNNHLLARALGLRGLRPFLAPRGLPIGVQGLASVSLATFVKRVAAACGVPPQVCAGGPDRVRRVGIVTGAGWNGAGELVAEGIDTFLTGEAPHHSYIEAEEAGLNLIYAGHYATETFGVKELAAQLARRFRIPWEFFDHPTGR